mmetsp:Transcript_3067/g.10254  ORF Transcript_3067/g.10254 Transcript_3067/m.10254 type:complete len:219 (-) Transcript_3067:733-1389(-)
MRSIGTCTATTCRCGLWSSRPHAGRWSGASAASRTSRTTRRGTTRSRARRPTRRRATSITGCGIAGRTPRCGSRSWSSQERWDIQSTMTRATRCGRASPTRAWTRGPSRPRWALRRCSLARCRSTLATGKIAYSRPGPVPRLVGPPSDQMAPSTDGFSRRRQCSRTCTSSGWVVRTRAGGALTRRRCPTSRACRPLATPQRKWRAGPRRRAPASSASA